VTVNIAEGQQTSPSTVVSGGVAFDPLTSGTTTVSATVPDFITTTAASVDISVSAPGITVSAPAMVGSGLQQYGNFSLGATNHGGVTVTISSSNASIAQVSPDASTAGGASIEVVVADGYNNGNYYIQGVEGATGQVTVTVTAPGFTDGSDTTEIVEPALRIIGLATSTTSLSPDDRFQVQVGIPNADNSNLSQGQAARAGGGDLTATVTNSNGTVGQLKTNEYPDGAQTVTVNIAEGQQTSPSTVVSGGVAFDPLTSGTTTVSATVPDFITTTAASVDISVSAPGITVSAPAMVGSGLQQYGNFSLGATNHGGVTVTISSSNASIALISPDASTAGSTSIEVVVADGYNGGNYYIQGVENATGEVTVTVTASGFTDGSDTTGIVQPALRIIGLATSTTSLSPDDRFQVQVGIPNADNSNLSQGQAARAGGGDLTATVTNSNGAIGQLVTDTVTGQSVTVNIAEGQQTSPSTVVSGGVAFDPLTSGTTTVSATVPDFITTTAASVDVVVSEE
jgi:hypothetical protein